MGCASGRCGGWSVISKSSGFEMYARRYSTVAGEMRSMDEIPLGVSK